jgi:hypothetical protein
VAALPPPPPAAEPPKTAALEAEVRAWVQSYCAAFQRKDTDSLIALGHISSQDEAARLREALASMNNLKLSCTNASVRLNGNRAEVSFDRTDRWTDPRGTEMERSLPRITKTLTRTDGRWVARP